MKKTGFKSTVSVLTLSLIFTGLTPITSFAAKPENEVMQELKEIDLSGYELNTIVDNEVERTIETEEDGKTISSTYDKINHIVTITTEGKEEPIMIDLNDTSEAAETESEITPFAVIAQENTWTNYEYTINTGDNWQLRRPNPSAPITKTYYKNVTEKSSNRTNLNNFKKSVDRLNTSEWKFIGSSATVQVGVAATLVVGAISGGSAALLVGLATAGITGAAANHALDIHRHAKDAHYYYFKV